MRFQNPVLSRAGNGSATRSSGVSATSWSKKNGKEAIEILTALGYFSGIDSGSFTVERLDGLTNRNYSEKVSYMNSAEKTHQNQ